MKVAVVFWGDACASDVLEYYDDETVKEMGPMPSIDVGLLVRDDKDGVLLARHSSGAGYRGMMFIPRKMIYKVKVYGRARG